MKFRIEKYNEGFVVEVLKSKWYGKKYWTHYISVSGMPSIPWYHSTFDYAMDSFHDDMKWKIISNSQKI